MKIFDKIIKKKQYSYFVSYFFKNNKDSGYGNVVIEAGAQIKKSNDILILTARIQKQLNIEHAIVLNIAKL